ncbi:hypothetical protein ABIC16_001943 [Sphingomonas sp. PvP055]
MKLATPAKIRPSTSGRTTCIARSAGLSPRAAAAHAARSDVASATWNTGTPAPLSGVTPAASLAEKAVALTIAAGASAATQRAIHPRAAPSLSDGTNSPITAYPRASKPACRAAIGATSDAIRYDR